MNIDPKELASHLRRQGHDNATADRVTELLAGVDGSALVAKHRARITHTEWDRKKPINGCSAEVILAQPNHDIGGVLYTLEVDGQVVFIQPFKPGVAGFQAISEAEWEQVAYGHADQVADGLASAEIVDFVTRGL